MRSVMERTNLVLFDLEETLIDEWSGANPLSVGFSRSNKFLSRLKNWSPDESGVMSWAIWNQVDKEKFNKEMRGMVEQNLSLDLSDQWILSMDQWSDLMLSCNKKIPRDEMFDLFKKEEILFLLARKSNLFRGKDVFLIDDAVDHELRIDVPTNNCSVTLLNVNEMPD